MNKIKIPLAPPLFIGNEEKYVVESVRSTWVRSGKFLDEFEKKFAKFCDVSYSTATSNGTTALHLLLMGLGIGKGDEVIVPDLSYVATANAVSYTLAKPVFVDVDREIWGISPDKIGQKITKNTKAIIVVHLFGHPVDMDSINKIARKYRLAVLEDVCQAHGATYKGKKVGSLSKGACFSFSGPKIITTGEGGMVVSNDKKIIERIVKINTDFMSKKRKYMHTDIGYNYRLTNLQAALGLAQLEHVDEFISRKIRNAALYSKFLEKEALLQLPPKKVWAKNVYWLYSIVLKKSGLRDKLMLHLRGQGVDTRPFFFPLHRLPMYKEKGKYPNSDYLAENGLSLPSGAGIKASEIKFVCDNISKFLKKYV
jgi:perosamine synthetase